MWVKITRPMGPWYVFCVSVGCHGKSNLPSFWKTLQGYWYDNSPRTRWFLKFSWIWTPPKKLKTKWFPDSHFYIHLYRHILVFFTWETVNPRHLNDIFFECLYKPLVFAPGCCKNKMPSERRTSPNYLVKSRFGFSWVDFFYGGVSPKNPAKWVDGIFQVGIRNLLKHHFLSIGSLLRNIILVVDSWWR